MSDFPSEIELEFWRVLMRDLQKDRLLVMLSLGLYTICLVCTLDKILMILYLVDCHKFAVHSRSSYDRQIEKYRLYRMKNNRLNNS